MTHSPLGSYNAGTSPLHLLRPGVKLAGLLLFALAVMLSTGLLTTALWVTLALGLALLAGMRWPELWRVTRSFALIAALLLAFHVWQTSWQRGLEVVGELFALILAASALTASTAVSDMLDTLTWLLSPLRRCGVNAERVAFAFSLVITLIPQILGIARQTRQAARARGLERNPRAVLVPFVLRTVAHAHTTGQAMHARGLGDLG